MTGSRDINPFHSGVASDLTGATGYFVHGKEKKQNIQPPLEISQTRNKNRASKLPNSLAQKAKQAIYGTMKAGAEARKAGDEAREARAELLKAAYALALNQVPHGVLVHEVDLQGKHLHTPPQKSAHEDSKVIVLRPPKLDFDAAIAQLAPAFDLGKPEDHIEEIRNILRDL